MDRLPQPTERQHCSGLRRSGRHKARSGSRGQSSLDNLVPKLQVGCWKVGQGKGRAAIACAIEGTNDTEQAGIADAVPKCAVAQEPAIRHRSASMFGNVACWESNI